MFDLNKLKIQLPKYLNKKLYLKNKKLLQIENDKKIFKENYESYINEIQDCLKKKKEISFLHSGHTGDIILNLPVLKELAKTHTCKLFIQLDLPVPKYYEDHPAGQFYMNKKIYDMLYPLLKKQTYISSIEVYDKQIIDINLNIIREMPLNLSFDNMRYGFHITGVQPDLNKKFLDCEKHLQIKDKIIIHRSFRQQNHYITYNFLEKYENTYFVGTLEEYNDLKISIRNLQFYDCKDFLEMAMIIKSSKIFIGNQSLGIIIAEGLKVPRILEASPYFPAGQVHGEKGFDFYFQAHFEKYFKLLYSKPENEDTK